MEPVRGNKIYSKRENAGVNRKLSDNYVWPPRFGAIDPPSTTPVETAEDTDEQSKTGQLQDLRCSDINDEQLPVTYDKRSVAISNHSGKSRNSNNSLEVQRRRLALETEKARQVIEQQQAEAERRQREAQNKLRILEMEHDLQAAEIEKLEVEEHCSRRSVTSNVAKWVAETQMQHQEHVKNINEDRQQKNQKNDNMHLLCQTLTEAIKSIAVSSGTSKLAARQVVEKDFPVFDGNPAEWPTFVTQFRRISSLCEYTPEEMIVKLQKCLKGEAKNSVAGMMMSADNTELIIKTLEMRFGRPDIVIETLLTDMDTIPPARENNLEQIIQISSRLKGLVETMKSLSCYGHLKNPQLLKGMLCKLPDTLKLRWGEVVAKQNGDVDLADFSNWLDTIAEAACYVSTPQYQIKSNTPHKNKLTNRPCLIMTKSDPNSTMECTYCDMRDHRITNCPKFKQDDVDTRWKLITKKKLCFSCLKKNHRTFDCRIKGPCGVDGCTRPHHKLLHKEPNKNSTMTTPLQEKKEKVLMVGQTTNNVLLRQVKVKLYGENGTVLETVALCDEASTVTLVDKAVAEHLGLKGMSKPLCIQWTNDFISRHEQSTSVKLRISGVNPGAKTFTMKNARTVENLSLPKQEVIAEKWTKFPHLKKLPITDIDSRPMLLIGQDNIHLTVARKVNQGPKDVPIATKTHLGWMIHGPIKEDIDKKTYTFHICHHENNLEQEADLHQLVKQSFSTESFGTCLQDCKKNEAEKRAQQIMENTARRVGNRYEIGLLWRSENIILPESKTAALRRLECVEKRMAIDNNFRQQYSNKIQEYIDKGYARKLSPEEAAATEGPRCWYLPHFGVINPNKPKKLRLVFDAASKSHGVSLNDNLLAGPDLLQSLVAVLIKFRQWKIAFCSDVREMFHQVMIRKEDRSAQRFLWREERTKPYDVYEMQVMTFGATCSPTCAQYIKNLNVKENTSSEEIRDAVIKKHYVDDYLDSTQTEDEALKKILEVRRIQKLGGFELVNWISNSRQLMQMLSDNKEIMKDLDMNCDIGLQRVLGLWWDAKEDRCHFRLKSEKNDSVKGHPTKRQVLRLVMFIFDPLGAWERLIRSIKKTLLAILNGQRVKEEILSTVLTEVEAIINARPLTHVSIDPNDPEALTPNHFLLGSSCSYGPPGEFNQNQCSRKEWRRTQQLIDSFWKRWLKEYLPTLTRRTKWTKDEAQPLQIGDVVLIMEENVPRNSWKLGKVTAVYPGTDGKVRVADVKTAKATYKRPTTKLCRLSVESEQT